jgi:hypothetical protein
MRKFSVLGFVLMLCGFAGAQGLGNVFFGYSYENSDVFSTGRAGFNGWQASVERKIVPGLSVVGDFGGHYGSGGFNLVGVTCPEGGCTPVNQNVQVYEATGGMRFGWNFRRYRPFAELEFGVAHLSASYPGTSTCFVNASGGGLDYRIVRPLAWRVQTDIEWTHFLSHYQTVLRMATGPVFRF